MKNALTLAQLLETMSQMFSANEHETDLYEEYRQEYEGKFNDGATGTEIQEALTWWDENPGFGEYDNPESEQKRLLSLLKEYSSED